MSQQIKWEISRLFDIVLPLLIDLKPTGKVPQDVSQQIKWEISRLFDIVLPLVKGTFHRVCLNKSSGRFSKLFDLVLPLVKGMLHRVGSHLLIQPLLQLYNLVLQALVDLLDVVHRLCLHLEKHTDSHTDRPACIFIPCPCKSIK